MNVIALTQSNNIIEGELTIKNKKLNFETGEMFDSFNDIYGFSKYETFENNYQDRLKKNLSKTQIMNFYHKNSLKKVWFYDKVEDSLNFYGFNNHWFNHKNEVCLKCKKKCKQSSKVLLVNCPKFIKK